MTDIARTMMELLRQELHTVGYLTSNGIRRADGSGDPNRFVAIHQDDAQIWPYLKVSRTGPNRVTVSHFGRSTKKLDKFISELNGRTRFKGRITLNNWRLKQLDWEKLLTPSQQDEILAHSHTKRL